MAVSEKSASKNAEDILTNGEADAVVTIEAGTVRILMREPDSVKVSAITEAMRTASEGATPAGATRQGSINIDFIYGNELTPVRNVAVVGGYVLGFGVFALIQSGIVIAYTKFVLKLPFAGAWPLALVIMLLIAMTAVVMGVLISALSRNEFQVMQFIPVVILPQVFFTGIIPIDTLPYNLGYLARVMPLYYGCLGLKGVLVYGYGLADVLPQILVLLGVITLLFAANIMAVKKYRAA